MNAIIDIATLPFEIQQQILSVKAGETVQFAAGGKVIAELKPKTNDSLMAAAGILSHYGIDGLDYQRQCREEWAREWE